MPRNLDLTALRSFLVVADTGGVTRTASQLHLSQSAVSMQIKRLEASLGVPLLDRSGRGVALTSQGEQLIGCARRIIALNDEIWAQMTDAEFEGEIVLGVPHDIIYPCVPEVLKQFHHDFPRVRVALVSSNTRKLLAQFDRGEADLILTTETEVSAPGEMLIEEPQVWIGAPGGTAWRTRPLRLAFETQCIFFPTAITALDAAEIPWTLAVEADSCDTIHASVSADLAVHISVASAVPPQLETLRPNCGLPKLPNTKIGLYRTRGANADLAQKLADYVSAAYGCAPGRMGA